MKYFADTGKIAELEHLYSYFPVCGVTTNPSIIAQTGLSLSKAIDGILKIIGDDAIHIQVSSERAEHMIVEAKKYKEYFNLGENYYTKIPVTEQGIKAIKMAKDAGMKVTATAIFTQQQAIVASVAGADYVAPYVSRLDNISSHGIVVVSSIVSCLKLGGLSTEVLAASFKTVDQVYRVSECGAQSATLSYEILEALRKHPMTDISMEQFMKDAKTSYDIEF
ncbi:MAG: fructose-6-phosphate aldolase [Bacteroidales bacterium]|jgi:fructose-6-phosphate aldolase 2|nr:fructose-6-phosphate aldolase [Bacteroidales bacterium]